MKVLALLALLVASGCAFAPPPPNTTGDDDVDGAVPATGDDAGAEADASVDAPRPDGGGGGACTQIAFRDATSATAPSSNSVTIPTPAGAVVGDLLVAFVLHQAGSEEKPRNLDTPSGWTLVRRDSFNSNSSIGQDVFTRAVDAGVPANHAFGSPDNQRFVAAIHAYAGVDLAAPVLESAGQTANNTASVVAPSVGGGDCSMLVSAFGIRTATTFTPPATMTERVDANNSAGSANITLASADEVVGAGATGTRTAVAGSNASAIGQSLALKPAP